MLEIKKKKKRERSSLQRGGKSVRLLRDPSSGPFFCFIKKKKKAVALSSGPVKGQIFTNIETLIATKNKKNPTVRNICLFTLNSCTVGGGHPYWE